MSDREVAFVLLTVVFGFGCLWGYYLGRRVGIAEGEAMAAERQRVALDAIAERGLALMRAMSQMRPHAEIAAPPTDSSGADAGKSP